MRRAVRVVLVGLLALVSVLAAAAAPVTAGEAPSSTVSTTPGPAVDRDIIPEPNSGSEPESAGDRGGAAQIVLLAAIVVGLSTIAGLAYRSSRRARAEQVAGAGRSGRRPRR